MLGEAEVPVILHQHSDKFQLSPGRVDSGREPQMRRYTTRMLSSD